MISRNDTILRGIETECENGCRHDNNNDQNCSTSVRKEDAYVKRSQSNRHQPHRAPLVGWQNGSPTIYSSFLQQSVDFDETSLPSKSTCNIREINLDANNIMEKSIDAIESLEPIETVTKPMKRSDAWDKIQETPVDLERYADTNRRNQKQVKDSIDSLSISEREYSSSFMARETKRKKPKVPDGGWGWVVVLASLIISMIADGISFSFGLLYIEFLHEFGASKSKTAWIGSLFMAVPLLSGPIMSALVDRYGCRNMTIVGGLISGLGFILSIFSNTIEIMYLTFGVIAGLGLGLCYVTAVVSIAFWFDKKRTLAVGLGACGTGIGTFVYAPITTYLIKEYGWRGTCLLLAGTFFNMIVAGTVMRDPEWWILEQRKQDQAALSKKSYGRLNVSSSDEFPGVEELKKLFKSDHAPEYFLQNLSTSTKAVDGAKRQTTSVVNLPTFVKRSEKVPLEVLELLLSNSRLYTVILENYPSLLLCRSLSDKQLQDSTGEICNRSGITMSMRLKRATESKAIVEQKKDSTSVHAPTKLVRKISRKKIEETNPLLEKEMIHTVAPIEKKKSVSTRRYVEPQSNNVIRTDSLPWLRRQFSTNTHYFKDIRVHRNSVMYRGAALNLHKYKLRASSCPDIYRNSMTTLAKENEQKWYAELIDLLKSMLDFSMFFELHFLLMSLSTILLFTWFIVPYFYLAEHMIRNGYVKSDAANLLSIIGITNTIGMIGLGWAGDQSWMNVSKTYAWCLIACGAAIISLSVFIQHYVFLSISSAAFGLFFASNFSFTPVILVELIPLERFTTAYGLSLLCQGIGNLLGPPLAGWFFDVTGSWELSFLMAGSWIIVSGILVGIIPYTRNRKIFGSGPIEMERTNGDDYLA
ncbi:MOT14 protein, partial [Acromyrmex insinuator]